jgi:trimethylamine--corrinoid protein Co-methyltransferase
VFSLAKLVFDDELCAQALHFVRDLAPKEDLPTLDLVRHLLDEKHLITAEHTLKYWPEELYLPSTLIDRDNRENWVKQGSHDLIERANTEVDKRLNAYVPPDTDPALDAELRRIIQVGMKEGIELPAVPPPPANPTIAQTTDRRAARRRAREQVGQTA